VTERHYDYVIVGAGSAGCTLAARLTEDADRKVLVLEAGGWDRDPLISIPLGWGQIYTQKKHDWRFVTEPEPALGGRSIECARGKVLGGSSSINALGYVRGNAGDYDRWAASGLDGWSYRDVLPYFRKQETWEGGADAYRGSDGPLSVRETRYADPLVDAIGVAAVDAGHGWNVDYNGARQDGFGRVQQTVRNGRRASAASAYLHPALRRPNLNLEVQADVSRLLISGGRVEGVEYRRGGKLHRVRSDNVILSAGVIKSPQILMLSGIGDPEMLGSHGIKVNASLPGVGRNLRDHISPILRFKRTERGPFFSRMRYDRIAKDMAQAWMFGTGPASDVPSGIMGFLKSDASQPIPDLQILLNAAPLTARPYWRESNAYEDGLAFRVVLLHPSSSGSVTLRSADPDDTPVIRQNFLTDPAEWATLRAGLRIIADLRSRGDLSRLCGPEIDGPENYGNAALDASISSRSLTTHHPLGTCRMGASQDAGAVVGADLRVHGVEGLHVVDAAVMPDMIGGNINAAVIMIAERAADMIRGRVPLPSAVLPISPLNSSEGISDTIGPSRIVKRRGQRSEA
jgi:4-pyridoxate dehydrogenase